MIEKTRRNNFVSKQSESVAFYRVPKFLFTKEKYRTLSSEAKLLYGIFLDRMTLSRKNDWVDGQGQVYIIFTLEEIMQMIHCANQKATRLMQQLEMAGLIEQTQYARGCPKRIYVKDCLSLCHSDSASMHS